MAHITGQQTLVAGKAELNGLSDAKLGPVDKLAKCPTDAAGLQDCPGYFGHIELAKPMYHIGFLSTVIKVLRCVSFAGSRLMVSRVSFWRPHCPCTHPKRPCRTLWMLGSAGTQYGEQ